MGTRIRHKEPETSVVLNNWRAQEGGPDTRWPPSLKLLAVNGFQGFLNPESHDHSGFVDVCYAVTVWLG